MTQAIKILLIEDEHDLSDNIKEMLAPFADVDQAYDGEEGEYQATEVPYDLIISDLMLPLQNGLEVIKDLRAHEITTPVLILTAKDGLDDKVTGFNVGADDYLTKPFHREELIVRVQALLRRAGVYSDDHTLQTSGLEVNLENRSVVAHGEVLKLIGKEFDILVYLIQNKNIIVTRDQIFDRVWGIDSDTTINVVNIYINNLRRKLETVGENNLIKTLRNIGFILEATDE
ncbi:response regulator transcription factor [Periweissella cryptocerci]|uniref:Response regulator transcription factor n=1 Tax=Periweissella cryptocerci TaxID=2506420 RepID=A0A4P6YUM5_9LACO|nr:response regulator transcription factor [Periweissella cryptocerci]QBO36494.1 response regulator transcription factor [Periweissella cryptocerci]